MTSRASYQLIATSILFLLFIANTPSAIAQSNKNTLPNDLFQGYWASTEPVQGMHYVLNFEKDKQGNIVSNRYIFHCNTTDNPKTAKPIIDTLTPTKKGLLIKAEGKYEYAIISVKSLQAKQRLLLNYKLTDPSMNKVFPNGLNYEYAYTPIVKPICQS